MRLTLSVSEAESVHAALEEKLEGGGDGDSGLELAYRRLGWRLSAARGGSGLSARISDIAREAESLEDFERKRDEELGPLLDGLESGENRDP